MAADYRRHHGVDVGARHTRRPGESASGDGWKDGGVMDSELFERGLACEWMGVKVADMTREQLIEFIGQLDWLVDDFKRAA